MSNDDKYYFVTHNIDKTQFRGKYEQAALIVCDSHTLILS